MAEPKFVPKPGQTDYTNIRYAPVINSLVMHKDKILLVRRSSDMRLYPDHWNGISGFLDDSSSIEDKIYEELREELGLSKFAVDSMERGRPFIQEAPEYKKTWLVVPVLVRLNQVKLKLNWEASHAEWFTVNEVKKLDLLPGFIDVVAEFYPEVL